MTEGRLATSRTGIVMAVLLCCALAPPAPAAPPLSANDWLSGGPVPPRRMQGGQAAATPDAARRPPALPSGRRDQPHEGPVGVSTLAAPDLDRAGTLSPAASGLPADLWQGASADQAIAAIAASQPRLPATGRLLKRLLLAQAQPPATPAGQEGQLFLARVDRLIGLGALDLAARLLDSAGPRGGGWQQRRFDIALLLDQDDGGCGALQAASAADTPVAARIWCLARAGDWQAAAITLHAAGRLGGMDAGQAARLRAFLDDSQIDSGTELPLPAQMTPLDFRLLAASGAPQPTADLPLPFAWTDIGGNGGWKSRVEAAERLARAGSLSGQQLRAIYLEDRPPASGGVWERSDAVRALDHAQRAGDAAAVTAALPGAVRAMGHAGLTDALSGMFSPDLARMRLDADPDAAALALTLALYAADTLPAHAYDGLAVPADPRLAWALALARGEADVPDDAPADDAEALIAESLRAAAPAPTAGEAPGLALLAAIADVDAGLDGDTARAVKGIAALRALGLEQEARGAALQLAFGTDLGTVP